MPFSDAERSRRYRDRKRGGPPQPRKLAPHGTRTAYRRHERAGEIPVGDYCSKCREAENERQRELYKARKQRQKEREQ